MKIREYLTEEKIPSNVKKEIINLIENPPKDHKDIWLKYNKEERKIEIGQTPKGKLYVYYDTGFTELTFLLVDICDMLDYKFEVERLKLHQTFFYIDK